MSMAKLKPPIAVTDLATYNLVETSGKQGSMDAFGRTEIPMLFNHTWNGLQERLAGCGDVDPDMGDRQLDTLLEFFLQTFDVML